jgi:hypothetical protein
VCVEEVAKIGVNNSGSDGRGGAGREGSTEDGKEGVEWEAEAAAEDVVAVARGGRVEGVGGGEFERVDLTDVESVCMRASVDGAEAGAVGNGVGDVWVWFGCWIVWVEAG